eukprot:TRINITY_DN7911_c0_g1_i1.p1 TRINITY_DN7911_c0_g1~~TRINITY_DN7911_c0_g1_i1.p1  ORF type:complete len:351 (-),score=76.35 TRINITY_DN7911_c0_g1_i1:18-959(-)
MSLADQASIQQLACPFDILPLAFILFLSVLLIAFAILRKGSKLLRGLCFHFTPVGSKQTQHATPVGKDPPEVEADAEAIHDAEVAEVKPPKDEEAATLDSGMLESMSDAAIKKSASQSRAQKKKEKKLRQRERVACPTQVELQDAEDSDPGQKEVENTEQEEPMVTFPCNMEEESMDLETAGEELTMEKAHGKVIEQSLASWCEDSVPQSPLPGLTIKPASSSDFLREKRRSPSGARRSDLPPPPACLPPLPPKEEEEECEMPLLSYNRALLLLHRDISKSIALGPPGLEHPAAVLAMQRQRGLHSAFVESAP